MPYKLIASDMDGTLLNSRSELTERTRDAILSVIDANIMFVTATGRPYCNIHVVNDILDVDMPFIVFNGSAAYMGKSNKKLFEKFLDFDLACEVFELGQRLGFPQIVWTSTQLWANRECEQTVRYRDFSTIGSMTVTSSLTDIIDDVPGISKVLWISDPETIKETQQKMSMHFAGRLNCYSSLPPFLEFVGIDSSKGAALLELSKLYGIDKSEMIAFGDAHNDVSMLEYVGLSVAMANAPDDIRKMCNHVTASNNEDGVAAFIERFVL